MPLYSYRCNNCGVQFDRKQSFEDAPLEKCPECGKLELRKQFTPVGIVFKGSGFYATDHRSASGSNGKVKTKETEDTKKDKKETKAEKKSDTKAEKKSK